MDQVVLNHVTKRFTTKTLGDIVAVDDFNLAVHEGECFSFLGPFRLRQNHNPAHDRRL